MIRNTEYGKSNIHEKRKRFLDAGYFDSEQRGSQTMRMNFS